MLPIKSSEDFLAVRKIFKYLIEIVLPFVSAFLLASKLGWIDYHFSSNWPLLIILSAAGLLVNYNIYKLLVLQYYVFDVFFFILWRSLVLLLLVIAVVVVDNTELISIPHMIEFVAIHAAVVFIGTCILLQVALAPPFRKPAYKVAIVGVTEGSVSLARHLHRYPHLTLKIVGFFESREKKRAPEHKPYKILAAFHDMRAYLHQNRLDHIIIALPPTAVDRVNLIFDQLLDTTATVHYLLDFLHFKPIREHISIFGDATAYTIIDSPQDDLGTIAKRFFDIVSSSLALLALIPLFIIIAILIKLDSKGSVFFKQKRWGTNGEEFYIYKFRSMTTEASNNSTLIQQASVNDARVTKIGAFIRRTSIDELPQLLNILKGEMSVVGPRPHAISHNEMYRNVVRGYMLRHKIKPGLTGWAQVHGFRGETDTLDKMEHRIEYDLEYVRIWTPWLDLYIILKTVILVLKRTNAY